jgi:PKD repeat protein
VTVTVPVTNQPPVAKFTSSVTGASVGFDGSSSTDDGTITSYAWDFGDGSTGTGVSPSHTYTVSGTYTVALTVTDNGGLTNKVTHPVTVTVTASTLASDSFARTASNGWGTADVGGAWTLVGTKSNFTVSSGTGQIRMGAAAAGPSIFLGSVSSTSTDVTTTFTTDKVPTGGGVFVSVVGRHITGVGDYRGVVNLLPSGAVAVSIQRTDAAGNATVVAKQVTVPGLTYSPGTQLRAEFQVSGTSPSQMGFKAWAASGTAPSNWQVTASDSTAALQAAGGLGLVSYLSASSTNAPVVASFSQLLAVKP